MEVAAYLGGTLHHLYQLLGQILGVGGHETDAQKPFYLLDLLQKPGECDGLVQISAIGIHVLSQKHDFNHPVRHKIPYFLKDILRPPAPLPAPHIGYDAIAAEVVAAKHDIYPRFKRILALNRQILHNLVRILPDIYNHSVRLIGGIQKLRKLVEIVGAEDQIHKGIAFPKSLDHRLLLHHASA